VTSGPYRIAAATSVAVGRSEGAALMTICAPRPRASESATAANRPAGQRLLGPNPEPGLSMTMGRSGSAPISASRADACLSPSGSAGSSIRREGHATPIASSRPRYWSMVGTGFRRPVASVRGGTHTSSIQPLPGRAYPTRPRTRPKCASKAERTLLGRSTPISYPPSLRRPIRRRALVSLGEAVERSSTSAVAHPVPAITASAGALPT